MSRGHAGFTLIEVLVGTTILSMMLALLTSALFGMARGARAGEQRLADVDEMRLVLAFLRRQLAEAVPLTQRDGDEDVVLFEGRPDAMQFVTHLPAHRGGGGLQMIDLRADDRTRALVLRYRNAWPDVAFDTAEAGAVWTRHALLGGLRQVRYRYFGDEDDETPAGWRESWSGADRLPLLIEVTLETESGESMPRLVVAVRTRTAIAQAPLYRLKESAR